MGIIQNAREIMADTIGRSADAIRGDHRVRLALLAVAFTVAFGVFVTATLFANSSYVPKDNVQELNYERSQVFVGGTGYRVDNYKRKGSNASQDSQNVIIGQNESGYVGSGLDTSQTPGTYSIEPNSDQNDSQSTSPYRRTYPSTGTNTGSPYRATYPSRSYSSTYPRRSYSYNRTSPYSNQQNRSSQNNNNNSSSSQSNKKSAYDKKKSAVSEDPKITIKGVKANATVKGKTKSFTVKARSYDGDDITGKKLVVKLNGVKLTPVKGSKYEGEILDGDNKIEVKATDSNGNSVKKTVKFKGVRDDEPEVKGKLDVFISADVLGIKIVSSKQSVEILENEQLSDVVKKYFKDADVKIVAKDSSYYSIERVKKKGILDDIPEETVAELEELGIPVPEDKDSLGTDDFGPGSGWAFMIDGEIQDDYMSDIDPSDKSTVEICYIIPDLE